MYNKPRLQAKVGALDHGHLEVFVYSESVHCFLGQETSRGEHGETTILKLSGDHEIELRGIGRPDTEGIELEVSGVVLVAELTGLIVRRVGRIDPTDLRSLGLGRADEGDDESVPAVRDLGEVRDGRAGDIAVEEEGRAGDCLADEEPEDRQHRHAAVSNLCLAIALQRPLVRLGGESQGIEEAHGGERTGHVVDVEGGLLHSGWRCLCLFEGERVERSGSPAVCCGRRREGGDRADEKGGEGELHHCYYLCVMGV
jgi:hypothetical protein